MAKAVSYVSPAAMTSMGQARLLDNSTPRLEVLIDFDGTVAPDDPTDRLLARFADPSWQVIETQWQCGKISSRECMARQVELLRMSPEDLDAEIRTIHLDPGFPSFLDFCRRHGAEVKIVSDGFDRVVSTTLRSARLSVPFFANKLEWQGEDRWRLAFPYARSDCRVNGANCKCSHAHRPHLWPRVVVGDGRSDFCMSTHAHYVIAKGALADYCHSRGQAYAPFANLHDATARLSAWLAKIRVSPAATHGLAPVPTVA
jgi:2,3-diketo-5-methylthio-1-phosphopentane phosphatase